MPEAITPEPSQRPDPGADGHGKHQRPPRASELLDHFLERHPHDQVTLGKLVEVLGDRAFGALLLIFGLLNMIPVPLPGLSTVLGIPMVLFAFQLMIGMPQPWLPRKIASVTLPRRAVENLAEKTTHWLQRAERLIRPRLVMLTEGPGERMIGLYILALSLVLCLPIPLGNWLPAFAVSLMSIGIIEKDGLMAAVGGVVGILAVTVVASVVGVALVAARAVLNEMGIPI